MKRIGLLLVAAALTGCTQRYVELSVRNQSGMPVHTVEVDYPGGSFGKSQVAAGQTFQYRFKPLHDGALKLSFNDPKGQIHSSDGPQWQENHGGSVEIVIGDNYAVRWNARHD